MKTVTPQQVENILGTVERPSDDREVAAILDQMHRNIANIHPAMEHELLLWPSFYAAILRGDKTFVIHQDARVFQVGDTLVLREATIGEGVYTGRELRAEVTYLLAGPLPGVERGYVVMAIKRLDA